jgi:ABC-type antimicrobial peptide transport system permease subunit
MIEEMSIIPLDKVIPFSSFIISILISLAITIIASIFPIRHALS